MENLFKRRSDARIEHEVTPLLDFVTVENDNGKSVAVVTHKSDFGNLHVGDLGIEALAQSNNFPTNTVAALRMSALAQVDQADYLTDSLTPIVNEEIASKDISDVPAESAVPAPAPATDSAPSAD